MNDALDIALHSARFWRDRGSDILIAALLAEFLIEAMWLEHSERRVFGLSRKWTMIAAAFVVFLGVAVERIWGTLADDRSDQIRTNLEHRIISLSPRWKLLQPQEVQKRLRAKLEAFKGQKVAIYLTTLNDFDEGMAVAELNEVLETAGWLNPWGQPISKLVGKKESSLTNVFTCCGRRNTVAWGIGIETTADAPEATKKAARALISALKAEDLDASTPFPDVGSMYGPIEGVHTDSQTIIVTFGKSVMHTF